MIVDYGNYNIIEVMIRKALLFTKYSVMDALYDNKKLDDIRDIYFRKRQDGWSLSTILQQQYLCPFDYSSNIAKGVIIGQYSRPMICLPVSIGKDSPSLAVHFLIDTGCYLTYLEANAVRALYGYKDYYVGKRYMQLNIWGVNEYGQQSHGDYEGVNILGSGFLSKIQASFNLDYKRSAEDRWFSLSKNKN